MDCFSYKDGHDVCVLRHLKDELAWGTDKQSHFMSNVMLLTYDHYTIMILLT